MILKQLRQVAKILRPERHDPAPSRLENILQNYIAGHATAMRQELTLRYMLERPTWTCAKSGRVRNDSVPSWFLQPSLAVMIRDFFEREGLSKDETTRLAPDLALRWIEYFKTHAHYAPQDSHYCEMLYMIPDVCHTLQREIERRGTVSAPAVAPTSESKPRPKIRPRIPVQPGVLAAIAKKSKTG